MAPSPGRLFDVLAFHAAFRANAPACVDLASGESLTYSALHARALASAAAMSAQVDAISGARIAVLARNSAAFVILSCACDQSGAILTPLNWRLPASELAVLLADCDPALIVADDEFADAAREAATLAGSAAQIVSPADVAGAHLPPPGRKVKLAPAAMSAPSILLYTSGTTGRAKGVIITRENALFSCLNFSAVACVGPSSVLLCDAPMFHTVGLVAIARTALHQGACLLVSDRFIPSTTLARLSDPALGVTHYFVVPQMVEALLRDPAAGDADFSRLTALFSGGGPLPEYLVTQCADRGVLLINGYGMSEVGSAIHLPLDRSYRPANASAVGFPAPFIDVQITGSNGRPVADGEVGEIWLRGPSVSPGYWNQPEATAASRAKAWFRTGDLGLKLADGAFAIVGRLKDMYISGGENVYPAEVEAVLRTLDGVIDAAVVGVADTRWGESGVAFIEAVEGTPLSERDVRSHCSNRLARYKQPAQIVFVESLPRTSSGKVQKAELKAGFKPDLRPA